MSDDQKTKGQKEAAGDAYAGSYGESVYALWHNPMSYDHLKMGPPYLPQAKKAALKIAATARQEVRSLARREANDSPMGQIFLALVGDYQGSPMAEMAALLACLRAAAAVHQAHHWQTRGNTFYGDHLLFDRIYGESVGFIDQVAERSVGAGSHLLVHPVIQTKQVGSLVAHFCGDVLSDPEPSTFATISLTTELRVLSVISMVHSSLEQEGLLTHGIDNLLQGIADKHEEFVYLLKQRSSSKTSYDRTTKAVRDPWKVG